MRKKKVLSVYGFLLLFGLGLAAFNSISFGSITGKVVSGEDYQETLFYGKDYEFKFYLNTFEVQETAIQVKGNLEEFAGKEHNLQLTGYVFAENGEVSGTYSNEIFLGAKNDINLNIQLPFVDNPSKVIIYIEDSETSVRIYKEIQQKKSLITGAVTDDLEGVKGYGSFLLGLLICGSLILFISYKMREHRKSMKLDHALSHKQQRSFIDLDVR